MRVPDSDDEEQELGPAKANSPVREDRKINEGHVLH